MSQETLIIDVREACRAAKTGKGQWTHGLVTELLKRKVPLTLLYGFDGDIPNEWANSSAQFIRISGRGMLWHLHVLCWLWRRGSSVYVSPVSYIVPAFAPASVRCIPVVHDLIAFRGSTGLTTGSEPHDRKATFIERLLLPRALRRVAHVYVISESTKKDLLARFPDLDPAHVVTVFAGPMHPHPERSKPDGRTIFCIGTLCPRKNQLALIRAFASLPDTLRTSFRLVIAGGRGWHDDEIVAAAKNTRGVEWLGYIDGATYESLMHTCTAFALPSFYEGFGMQILDAMQRGIPVLTSDRGSLKELAEGAALIVDPDNVQSIASGLERLLTDPALRSELQQKAIQRAELYSWRKTADLFLTVVG